MTDVELKGIDFTGGRELAIDLEGLRQISDSISASGADVRTRVVRNDGWEYESASLTDALESKHYGNFFVHTVKFLGSDGSEVSIGNVKDETLVMRLPAGNVKAAERILEIVRKYPSPYRYFVSQPWWNVVNLSTFLPLWLGHVSVALIRNPSQVLPSARALLTGVSPPSPSLWSDIVAGTLWFLVALAVVATAALPLRRVYRFCFPFVEFDVLPNARRNEHAKWGRGLLYSVPLAVFGSTWAK